MAYRLYAIAWRYVHNSRWLNPRCTKWDSKLIADAINKDIDISEFNNSFVEELCKRLDKDSCGKVISSVEAVGGQGARYVLIRVKECAPLEVVYPLLHSMAWNKGITIYDPQLDSEEFAGALELLGCASSKFRCKMFNALIRKTIGSGVRKIVSLVDRGYTEYVNVKETAYAVAIDTSIDRFKDIVLAIDKAVSGALLPKEELQWGHDCLSVKGPGYRLTYSIETTNQYCGIMNNGVAEVVLTHHMGSWEAHKVLKNFGRELLDRRDVEDVYRRCAAYEFAVKYPNPAKRFAENVKLALRLKRLAIPFSYGQSRDGGDVSFCEKQSEADREESRCGIFVSDTEVLSLLYFFKKYDSSIEDRFYEQSYVSVQNVWNVLKDIKHLMFELKQGNKPAALVEMINKNRFAFCLSRLEPNLGYVGDWTNDEIVDFVLKHEKEIRKFLALFVECMTLKFSRHELNLDDVCVIEGP